MSDLADRRDRARDVLLLASVFVVAVAGLVYELIAGTLTTYLLGSSITVFSLVIGLFLSAMGLGAWLSRFAERDLARVFVEIELALGAVGGCSALLLFASYSIVEDGFPLVAGLLCVATGALVGVEIPLLLRIVEERVDVRVAVAQVLAIDYLGALVGSIAFPLVLLPHLGLVRSAALLGLMNVAVALFASRVLSVGGRLRIPVAALTTGAGLVAILLGGGRATTWIEDRLYDDNVVIAVDTRIQRVVVTRWRDDWRLYLDGHLQFSSIDEYRYHESLVHPAMSAARSHESVLVLGGGDGMAVREVLKYTGVRSVDLVDLDPQITTLFRDRAELAALNGHALSDPRVQVHHVDAVRFLEQADRRWDVVIMDLPDPHDPALARLYSDVAFGLALRRTKDRGALVTQATSPFAAPEAFWCIVRTLESAVAAQPAPIAVRPYHVHVPTFGEWGFALASVAEPEPPRVPTRFLGPASIVGLFELPRDLQPRDVSTNRLGDAILARYYREGWKERFGP